eukprot:8651934-Alexandrium_andersonii.AAC.1
MGTTGPRQPVDPPCGAPMSRLGRRGASTAPSDRPWRSCTTSGSVGETCTETPRGACASGRPALQSGHRRAS